MSDLGKDTYCEKNASPGLDELEETCNAVKPSGIVVRFGTRSRRDPGVVGGRRALQSKFSARHHESRSTMHER